MLSGSHVLRATIPARGFCRRRPQWSAMAPPWLKPATTMRDESARRGGERGRWRVRGEGGGARRLRLRLRWRWWWWWAGRRRADPGLLLLLDEGVDVRCRVLDPGSVLLQEEKRGGNE